MNKESDDPSLRYESLPIVNLEAAKTSTSTLKTPPAGAIRQDCSVAGLGKNDKILGHTKRLRKQLLAIVSLFADAAWNDGLLRTRRMKLNQRLAVGRGRRCCVRRSAIMEGSDSGRIRRKNAALVPYQGRHAARDAQPAVDSPGVRRPGGRRNSHYDGAKSFAPSTGRKVRRFLVQGQPEGPRSSRTPLDTEATALKREQDESSIL
eukprot:1378649-Amorphochlora_amoeboformis.AAC.1